MTTTDDDISFGHLCQAEGVLDGFTNNKGAFKLTFVFEGRAREEMVKVLLADGQMMRVTVEAMQFNGVAVERNGDVWAGIADG